MKTIKLDGWKLFSSRPGSDNYYNGDETVLLKVFKGKGEQVLSGLEREKAISDYVAGLGIKTPAVYDICRTEDGRFCATYEYIKNKKSLIRAISENQDLADPYMKLFAEAGKLLHSKKCDAPWVPDYREQALNNISLLDKADEETRNGIRATIESFPDGDSCLHGDFNPGNFIIADGVVYAIDLSDFTKGHYMVDPSQFYMMTHTLQTEHAERLFHMEQSQYLRCWSLFADYYFDGNVPPESELRRFMFIGQVSHLHFFPFAQPYVIEAYTMLMNS